MAYFRLNYANLFRRFRVVREKIIIRLLLGTVAEMGPASYTQRFLINASTAIYNILIS